jgi:hypothetical protein
MPNIRKTISLPKPLHDFAIKESKRITQEEKGEARENLSMFVSRLIKEAKHRSEPLHKKAA